MIICKDLAVFDVKKIHFKNLFWHRKKCYNLLGFFKIFL